LDLSKIEELIALMRKSGLTQLSLELPDYKVSITRGAEATDPAPRGGAPATAAPGPTPPPDAPAALPLTVISPVVGVFHNGGSSPGRRLIEGGGRVKRGELLATIEAMKVPNEIRSPVDGLVTSVAVEDGGVVEYGQTLFLILPEEGGEADEGESPLGIA
jgi:acetyl-CoA carboxylase biotin carboxyl carrier protein